MAEIWQHYIEILSDPAHCLVEFTFVLLDYLVIGAVATRLKRHFHRDLTKQHTILDAEHGIEHHGQATNAQVDEFRRKAGL